MSNKLVSDHWRGLDFYQPAKDKHSKVIIVGCGAIGSYTAFGLARLGVKELVLIDHDTVEGHNLPNQFFAESLNIQKGIFKVHALEATIRMIVPDVKITSIPLKWEQVNLPETLTRLSAIVTTVDCMEVRAKIFKDMEPRGISLLLDARIGGLFANVYAIAYNKWQDHRQYYSDSLYPNSRVEPLPCTGQSICDVSMAVAGELVGRYRTAIMNNWEVPAIHTFHDYKYNQSWAQQINPHWIMTDDTNDVPKTDEVIDAVGK